MQSYDALFWYEWKRNPFSTAYNISLAYELRGHLDFFCLQQALDVLVKTHPYLRSRFVEQDGVVCRHVIPDVPSDIDIIVIPTNISSPTIGNNSNPDEIVRSIRDHIFNLEEGPLFKFALLTLAADHHILVMCFHHLVCDGVSEQRILEAISEYYNTHYSGASPKIGSSTLVEDPGQSDLMSTRSEREEIAAKNYWQQQVQQITEHTNDLSLLHTRGQSESSRGSFIYFEFPASVVQQLQTVCDTGASSVFCLLMTVYLIVLHRLSDNKHWMISYATNQRSALQKNNIGCFINVVPFVFLIQEGMTFQQLWKYITELRHFQKTHQWYPFLEVIHLLRASVQKEVGNAFSIALMQTHVKKTPLKLFGLCVTVIEEKENATLYDLCLEYEFLEHGLQLRLNYRKDRFNQSITDGFPHFFEKTFMQLLKKSDQSIAGFHLLPPSEALRILSTWNHTGEEYVKSHTTVITLFQEQVQRTPQATALIFKDQQLSYAELDRASDFLAMAMLPFTTGAAVKVPLLLDRGIDQVVAMLGVLKTGGAYVPIDTQYPLARKVTIINDCQSDQMLVSANYLQQAREIVAASQGPDIHIICMQGDDKNTAATSGLDVTILPMLNPLCLAYVLYTSGSTGLPKGVQISHRSLAHFLVAMKALLAVDQRAVFMQITPYSFDISGLEVYLPLLVGGTCVIADSSVENQGRGLSQLITQYHVGYLQTTPTRWQLLLQTGWQPHADLVMLCGGEALSTSLAQKLLSYGKALWNVYGPTETTIWSTAYRVPPTLDNSLPWVPIGKPIANTVVYLLDGYLQPVPVGTVGELYIGGMGVAQGYLHREDLTQQRFIPCPDWIEKEKIPFIGSVLYKTGDACRWLPDGHLWYVGRLDQQIKYHGHRIELGEIEAALLSHPAVKQAAVVVEQGMSSASISLTAYYTCFAGVGTESVLRDMLRTYLLTVLPAYSIPQQWVLCDHLPITVHGKVDRRALGTAASLTHRVAATVSDLDVNTSDVECSATEQQLMRIWEKIFKDRPVCRSDDFFERGGDSVSALRICYEIQQQYQRDCSVADIFRYSRLHQFATWFDATQVPLSSLPGETSLLRDAFSSSHFPLSFAQQQFLFLSALTEVGHYNIVLAWKLTGEVCSARLAQALDTLCAQQAVLRTVYRMENNALCQVVLPFSLQPLCLEKIAEAEIAAIIRQEQAHIFQFDVVPPVRFRLLHVASRFFVLLVNIHHVAFDASSIPIFCRQLSDHYNALAWDNLAAITPERMPYHIYAKDQFCAGKLQRHIDFWKQYLRGYQPFVWPTDYRRPEVFSYRGAVYSFRLPVSSWERIKNTAIQHKTTVFTVMLALLCVFIKKHTCQEEMVVGVPVNTRHSVHFAETVGCFVHTIPVRCSITDAMSWIDVLSHTQAQWFMTLPYQEVALDELLTTLELARTAVPFMSMLATWEEGGAQQALSLGGVSAECLSVPVSFVKADLHMRWVEKEQSLTCHLEYATDLFHPHRIERSAGYFLQLLDTVLENPRCTVANISLLTAAEYRQWMETPYHANARFSVPGSIDALMDEQVHLHPDDLALVCGNERMTYAGLYQYAQVIAQAIQVFRAAHPDNEPLLIGLRLPRTAFLVAALLGVFKAGAAYLPLALDLPEQRILEMLRQSGCRLVITEETDFFYPLQQQYQELEVWDPEIVHAKSSFFRGSLDRPVPSTLAYVIFTSGSTGKPKGVMVDVSMIVNCALSVQKRVGITRHHVWLSVTDYSFDVSVLDFVLPFLVGGTLVLANDQQRKDPECLLRLLETQSITVMQATPTMWEMLVQYGWKGAPGFKILSAGEALTEDLVQALLPKGLLYNLYGPTEATIYTTCAWIRSASEVSIGRPLDNVRCYILDRYLKPVPPGIFGELYIGGAGVAAGYIHNPVLTAERFISHPEQRGIRLYKTGDVVRWNRSHDMEFQGRGDHQVKIRGYRIELGEIEHQLNLHPQVLKSVVFPHETEGDRYLVSCVIPRDREKSPSADALIQALKHKLPPYMIPRTVFCRATFPLTVSGKIDRRQLQAETAALAFSADKPPLETTSSSPTTTLEKKSVITRLLRMMEHLLEKPVVDIHKNLFDLGMHSLLLLPAQKMIQEIWGITLPLVEFFKYSSVMALAMRLTEGARFSPGLHRKNGARDSVSISSAIHSTEKREDIAIIGMSGQFPGAANLTQFWENIQEGRDTITHFSRETLEAAGISDILLQNPDYVRAKGILTGAEFFDAAFFEMSPQEAILTDPQQRLFMEQAWSALENAGYTPQTYSGVVGVYVGSDESCYAQQILGELPSFTGDAQALQRALANNTPSLLSTKISYKLNLTGPSFNIHTACSTGLVVVAMACQQLRERRCDMALAGAVSVKQPQTAGYVYQSQGITAPDGQCRPFSSLITPSHTGGTVPSAGVGVVVLKRLEAALADHDNILAVIKSEHINNDGAEKIGYTAPSVTQQARCIATALEKGHIAPHTIQYVEAHGTGTVLGDPIEIAALSTVWSTTPSSAPCAIGSVKSNIGHTDAAAGIAGFIKTVQMLQNQTYAPTVMRDGGQARCAIPDSSFYVLSHSTPWERPPDHPRRAGVNALGMGGTNVFMVLEEYIHPSMCSPTPLPPTAIFPFSAKTPAALTTVLQVYRDYLQQCDIPKERDDVEREWLHRVAFTLQNGRTAFHTRIAVVASTRDMLMQKLHYLCEQRLPEKNKIVVRECVFFFPGQGGQYRDMGWSLYQTESVFREALDACMTRFDEYLPVSLKSVIFSAPGMSEAETDTSMPSAGSLLDKTKYAQPALFSVEYALARLWESWGCVPRLLIGHSLGEYVAAHLAGVFSLEDAIRIVAYRAKQMYALEAGAMLSVPMSAEELAPYLEETQGQVTLATVWSPALCIVSGYIPAMHALKKHLIDVAKIEPRMLRRVNTSHAFHSPMMRDIVEDFKHFLESCTFYTATIPIIANRDGQRAAPDALSTPTYWAEHLERTVYLSESIQTVFEICENPAFISVGPGSDIHSLLTPHRQSRSVLSVRSLMAKKERGRQPAPVSESIYAAAARLWEEGVPIDWKIYTAYSTIRRLPLPTYSFQRQAYWPTRVRAYAPKQITGPSHFYSVSWQRGDKIKSWDSSLFSSVENSLASCWIIFIGTDSWSRGVSEALLQKIPDAICVYVSEQFSQPAAHIFNIRLDTEGDFHTLWQSLKERKNKSSYYVIDLLPYASHSTLYMALQHGYYHLVDILKAFAVHALGSPLHILIAATGLFAVGESDQVDPVRATLVGAIQSIPYEFSEVHVQAIDVEMQPDERVDVDYVRFAHAFLGDILSSSATVACSVACYAYRQGYRWKRIFIEQPVPPQTTFPSDLIRSQGTYLIIGGLGGIGLTLAETLVTTYQAHVVLLSRSTYPDPDSWSTWLYDHTRTHPQYAVIERLQKLRENGGSIACVCADVSCQGAMQKVLSSLQATRSIQGVIHAAGVPSSSLIINSQSTVRDTVLASKVQGIYVLSTLLKAIPLDFIVFCSSLTSITGGIGQVDYGAANACLDSLVDAHFFHPNARVCVINWNRWPGVGMSCISEDAARIMGLPASYQTSITNNALRHAAEGAALFISALQSPSQPVLISQQEIEDYRIALLQASTLESRVNPPVSVFLDSQQTLSRLMQRILGVEKIADQDNFFDLGGHSLMALQVLAEIKKVYHVSLSLADLYASPTCADLWSLILHKKTPCSADNPIVLLKKKEAGPALFCIHPVGGMVFCYHTLAESLPSLGNIYALQDLGLYLPDFCFETLEAMAHYYVQCIQRVAAPPYFLIGYSLGGTLAFEIAQQLIAQQQAVHFVGLIDSWAIFSDLSKAPQHFEILMQRQLASFRAQFHAAGLSNTDALLSCQWSRMQLLMRYQPRPLPILLHLFKAHTLLPEYHSIADPYNHWNPYATAGIVCHMVPGDHETILMPAHVRTLARCVEEALSAVLVPATEMCIV